MYDHMQENIIVAHHETDKIEKPILDSENGWKHTFDAIPNLVAIFDTDHKVVKVNKAMAERLDIFQCMYWKHMLSCCSQL